MAHNISKKLSKIGSNIKKLRTVKKISQAEFAALFELARPSIGAYEEGRSEPKIETIIEIANYFRISIDVLLTRELTVSEIYSLDQLNQTLDKVHGKDSGQSTKASRMENGISLVRIKDHLDYIVNHRKTDFLSNLSKINVPMFTRGNYRAFELNGSEMEYHQQGLHHGDILIGKFIDLNKTKGAIGKVYVVVHSDQLLVRRMDSIGSKFIKFISDDPNYESIELDATDFLELWEVNMVISGYLQRPSLLEERILLLEKEVSKLKEKFENK